MTALELPRALLAERCAAEIPHDLYGFLVGSWSLDVRWYAGVALDGQGVRGELHAARTLEGRALQDTWIMPIREERRGVVDAVRNMYGTTLRVWDPAVEGWRITWINPARNYVEQQIGRASGEDIVQLGMRHNGALTRWRFTEIAARSFRWQGDVLASDGETWTRETEFFATRA